MKQILSRLGEIKIHQDLISQIVKAATLAVEGVASVGSANRCLISRALPFLTRKSIKVEFKKDLKIEVPLIVQFGHNIPKVAAGVQEEILKSLTKSLDIETAYIVVKVKGLEGTAN